MDQYTQAAMAYLRSKRGVRNVAAETTTGVSEVGAPPQRARARTPRGQRCVEGRGTDSLRSERVFSSLFPSGPSSSRSPSGRTRTTRTSSPRTSRHSCAYRTGLD